MSCDKRQFVMGNNDVAEENVEMHFFSLNILLFVTLSKLEENNTLIFLSLMFRN